MSNVALAHGENVLLPAEMWKTILGLAACEAPPAFDTSPLPPSTNGDRSWMKRVPGTSLSDQMAYSRRVTTRLSIILVSKWWHELGEEFLYECVRLGSQAKMKSFCARLEKNWDDSNAGGDPSTRHLGWFTKRLHLLFLPSSSWISSLTPTTTSQLPISSLQHCPNLEVLVVESVQSAAAKSVLADIMPTIRSSLRHFECLTMYSNFPFRTLEFAIMLQVLSITGPDLRSQMRVLPWFEFPFLHTLKVIDTHRPNDLSWITRWKMPALQRLEIEPVERSPQEICDSVFKKNGKQIRSLDLHWSSYPHLSLLFGHCPSLEALNVSYTFIPIPRFSETRPIRFHPTLARVGIHLELLEELDFDESAIDNVMWALTTSLGELFSTRNPVLKCVHFLDLDCATFTEVPWRLSHISMWEAWISKWRDAGVRFEFCGGDLVEVPDKIKMAEGLEEWGHSGQLGESFDKWLLESHIRRRRLRM